MGFGESNAAKMGQCTKQEAFAILDHFVSQGGNFLDTANGYSLGESEQWLGEWMKERKNRDDIVLATKYAGCFTQHEPNRIQVNYGGNGSKSMRLSVDASLKKLQTAYIDLLYLHWWDFSVSIPELMQSLNDLVRSGKVLYLGISDTPAWVVSKANQYARDHGLRQFVVYQGHWNAGARDFERDIIPMCLDEGMGICPYASLGGGRFQTESEYKEREKNNPGRKGKPYTDREKAVAKVLEKVANEKGAKLTDVALAYVRSKAPYVFPIVGCRKMEHLTGNIKALSTSLGEKEVAEIDSAYEFDPGFPHTFLSGTLFTEEAPRGTSHPGEVWLTNAFANIEWVDKPKAIGT